MLARLPLNTPQDILKMSSKLWNVLDQNSVGTAH